MSEVSNNGVPGYTSSTVGDYTILTPEDKKASVFQKVTPKEQYLVAREVANRAIDEINAIRANRQSSFTDGINAANIAARRQAAETYGATLPGGSNYDGAREAAYATADAYKSVLDDAAARGRLTSTAPQIARITGDWGYGPSIPYPKESFSDWTTDNDDNGGGGGGDDNGGGGGGGDDNGGGGASGNYDEWINQQYRELLGRDAGEEGLTYWSGDLEGGQTKQQVIDNIKRSDEYKKRHNTYGIGPEYDEYEARFADAINEGSTLEEAMRHSRVATPLDWERAFGSSEGWKKIGGGSKSGSGASRPSSGGLNSSGPNRGAASKGGTSRNSHNRGGF
jgi:uncharacterized membrane protein YgcG